MGYRLKLGDRVEKTMGVRMIGTIIAPFPWAEHTDGSYAPPGRWDVPVLWDDGTKGYIHKNFLRRIAPETQATLEVGGERTKRERELQDTIHKTLQDDPDDRTNWYEDYLAERL